MDGDPLRFVKPEVQSIAAYTLRQPPHRIKLNQNENPFGFPAALKEETLRRLRERDWARYPDFHLQALTERLAAHANVEPDQVLVGNGSNELLQMTLLTVLSPGDVVLIVAPTFSLYHLQSTVMGARPVEHLLSATDGFALVPEDVIATAHRHKAKVIILCSPNNPTGNTFPEAAVRRLVEEGDALVFLDEAYHEFSDQNFRPLLDEYDNIVLFRTFSKAMAMAGLRVGYMLAHPTLIREVGKVKLPYGLNIMSETAALVALAHREALEAQVQTLCQLRDELLTDLAACPGVHPYPSEANFILCRFDQPTDEVFAHLVAHGILVRDVSHYPGLEGHLRISVGTREENTALLEALRR